MRPKQTLFLGLILLVPVLGFLFLNSFGTNRFALRTYLPDRVDSTLVGGKWQRDTLFHQLRDFRFSSQSGRVITQKDFAGGLYVAGFFFGPSADTINLINSQLARVQEKFRHEPRVRIASFLTASGQDSGAAPGRYAEQFGAIAGKWYFLTGDKTTVRRFAKEEFRLPDPVHSSGQLSSAQVFLVDRDKRVRGIYTIPGAKEVERLITEISIMLYSYDHDNPNY